MSKGNKSTGAAGNSADTGKAPAQGQDVQSTLDVPAAADIAAAPISTQQPGPDEKPPVAYQPSQRIEALFVRARPATGFRRAGFFFPAAGIGIALDALTEAQAKAIAEEPNLVAEVVEVDIDKLDELGRA